MVNMNTNKLPRLALLPLLIHSACTYAQDTETETKAKSGLFEVIEVTAQKRVQNINEVGVTVNAFSDSELDALGVQSATDVLNFTPGATVTYLGQGTPIYTIRGIGFDDYAANSTSTVGVNIDEVALPYPMLTRSPQFDISRIEVLKGPQGTLYGRNTTGGAVNIILNKPEHETYGSVKVGYESDNAWTAQGFFNTSLADSLAGRVSVYKRGGGAWQTNAAAPGQENGDDDMLALRGQLLWDATDNVTLTLMTEYHRDKGDSQIPKYAGIFAAAEDGYTSDYVADEIRASTLPNENDPNSVSWDSEGNTFSGLNPDGKFNKNNKGLLTSLRLDWDLGNMQFVSLSSFNDYERDEANAWDGVEISNWDSHNKTEMEVWSQEFRLSSEGEYFTWVAGLYMAGETLNEASTGTGAVSSPNLWIVPDDIGPAFGLPTSDINGDGKVDAHDAITAGLGFDLFSNIYSQENRTNGAFIHTEYKFAEDWNLILAARYSDDKATIKDSCTYDVDGTLAYFMEIGFFGGAVPYEQGQCVTLNYDLVSEPYNKTVKSDNISGKIGLDYKVSKDILVYANLSNGYKSGGFGAVAASSWTSLEEYKPEEVTSFELGFKSTLLEGALQLNGAVYAYDYKNKQVSAFVADPLFGNLGKIVNAPKSTIKGAEVEANWYVGDATVIRLTGSYLDT